MKKALFTTLTTIRTASLFLLLVDSSEASERVFPLFELTDEDVALIDIKDGSIEEWKDIVGEPTVTALEFRTDSQWHEYDPASMDFRIWLAWHGGTNRIYGAMERADDIYINDFDRHDPNGLLAIPQNHDSYIRFAVDGDASGGDYLRIDGQAQSYEILAEVYDNGPHVYVHGGVEKSWYMKPPFADGGGGTAGENPVISVTEFYVTPYDYFLRNGPEKCVVSELYRGKSIGFAIWVVDIDAKQPSAPRSYHYLLRGEAGTDGCSTTGWWATCSDGFATGLLLGPGGELPDDSAVESITWGRIKAQFVK